MTVDGPWLLVVGMHRSGTSALTGALASLGFNPPHAGDRMDWPESNAEHWESLALSVFDDRLLDQLGGSWDAPPEVPATGGSPLDATSVAEATDVAAAAFPRAGANVWKDPRVCLLLPFWREILPPPLAAVLLWRSPLAVAHSLERRDGTDLAFGVALWERYLRCALSGLDGLDTFVINYEELLADPSRRFGDLVDWLASLGQFVELSGRWDASSAAAAIETGAATVRVPEDGLLSDAQRALVGLLSDLAGAHRPFRQPPLPDESPWTGALIATRRGQRSREVEQLRGEIDRLRGELEAMRSSTSWRVTGPLRRLLGSPARPGTPS